MIKLYKEKSILLFACFLVLYETMCYLSNDMYLPALPILAKDLNINAHLAQMTITAWFLGAASLHLFLGPLLVSLIGGVISHGSMRMSWDSTIFTKET